MTIAHAALRSLFYRKVPGVLSYTILDPDKHGMGAITRNQVSNLAPVFGRLADGTFKVQIATREAPSDFDAVDVMFLEEDDAEVRMLQMLRDLQPIYLQRLTFGCPPTDNRALWKSLEHLKIEVSGGSQGASPDRAGADGPVESTINLKVVEQARLYKLSLSGFTTTEIEAITCIDGLRDPNQCLPGYPGEDQVLVFGAEGAVAAAANALYSMNGGSTIAAYTTDATPFTEVDRDIVTAVTEIIDEQNFRVIYGAGSVAAIKAQWAYQDFPVSNDVQTAATWNLITIAATVATDAIEAMAWFTEIDRIYVATAGDIYVSTDKGEADPGAADFTGSNALAQFAMDEDKSVWCVGATNTILRELAGSRGVFAARTGPSGGGAFTSITFADDGLLFAGNGTKIFLSKDKGATVGGWTELNDFGASHSVVNIQCKSGTSQCLRAIVDDTTPGVGSVYESEDGGNSWRLVVETANDGYNDAFFSKNPNKSVLVGDVVAALGVIELLA